MSKRSKAADAIRLQLVRGGAIAIACAAFAGWWAGTQRPAGPGPGILVYADADYMDSSAWIEYLDRNGFRVRVVRDPSVELMHHYFHIAPQLRSHHIAIVDGYLIEGHVPAEDIRRLLAEKPDALGLAVAGIPGNSPGMEGFSRQRGPFSVVLFGHREPPRVFAMH